MFQEVVKTSDVRKVFTESGFQVNDKTLIFIGSQFCFFDQTTSKWNIGDVFDGSSVGTNEPFSQVRTEISIPDNCSITSRFDKYNDNETAPIVVTGGNFGEEVLSSAFGLSLKKTELNGMSTLEASTIELPDMPQPRFLH